MVEKVCEVCGAEFSVKPHRAKAAKYCSRKCSHKAQSKKVRRVCENCDKVFETHLSHIKRGGGKYCSLKCKYAATEKEPIIKTCKVCGKLFEVKQHVNKRGYGLYCSKKCFGKDRNKRITKLCEYCGKEYEVKQYRNDAKYCSYECNHNDKKNRVLVKCNNCGKEFSVWPSRLNENSVFYCSNKCYGKSISGNKHQGWNNGSSFEPYCELFSPKFKERVRTFWDRKCGICGKSEKDNGQRLSVHHVDYDKESCCNPSIPLFIPTCRSCHAKTNNNRTYWEEMLTNYIMIWFDGKSYDTVTNEIAVVNGQEITA